LIGTVGPGFTIEVTDAAGKRVDLVDEGGGAAGVPVLLVLEGVV
jgi:hypothetical protein